MAGIESKVIGFTIAGISLFVLFSAIVLTALLYVPKDWKIKITPQRAAAIRLLLRIYTIVALIAAPWLVLDYNVPAFKPYSDMMLIALWYVVAALIGIGIGNILTVRKMDRDTGGQARIFHRLIPKMENVARAMRPFPPPNIADIAFPGALQKSWLDVQAELRALDIYVHMTDRESVYVDMVTLIALANTRRIERARELFPVKYYRKET